ncbi:MAG: pyruvate kinase [Acidobacteriaceae bacterium]
MKKTKIICTLGPASQTVKMITEMVENGMNVARLNFSHGNYESFEQLIKNIRTVAERTNTLITIIQDLHGPKIRVGSLSEPLKVKIGQTVIIGKDFTLDTEVAKSIRPKQRILIEDGLIEMEVEKIVGDKIYCIALSPGKILPRKGVNLPRTKLKIPILTKKDIDDLKFGLKHGVDYVALSFVRSREDVTNLRRLIKRYNPKSQDEPKIIAKIEKPEAVKNFDSILSVSDAIMVARGDLGVEMPENQVPIIQKTIIRKCLQASKPVIVATQMLDSMIRNPRPTRAEVSDVANAVIDQTDCVMLSGETAFGRYPIKSVAVMSRIISATEKSHFLPEHKHIEGKKIVTKTEAVSEGVYHLASNTGAKVIVGATETGSTARQVARQRPTSAALVMLTPNKKTLQQINLIWGVEAHLIPRVDSFEKLMGEMIDTVKHMKMAKKGDRVIVVTGEPLGLKENLNLVEVKTV